MTALNTTISLRFTPIVVKYCPKIITEKIFFNLKQTDFELVITSSMLVVCGVAR